MKHTSPLTAESVKRLSELGCKYGVTWKHRDYTDTKPMVTERLAALLSEYDDDLVFRALRQCGYNTTAEKQLEVIQLIDAEDAKKRTFDEDAQKCGPLWFDLQSEKFHQRRAHRARRADEIKSLGPWSDVDAVVGLLRAMAADDSLLFNQVSVAVAHDVSYTHPPGHDINDMLWYGQDSQRPPITESKIDSMRCWINSDKNPAFKNLLKNWHDYANRGCARNVYAAPSVYRKTDEPSSGDNTPRGSWEVHISIEARVDHHWIVRGRWASEDRPPSCSEIMFQAWIAMIEDRQIGNPCLSIPRQLDERMTFDDNQGDN